jgi:hypothetical protein
MAVSGSCDAGRTTLCPDLDRRVFGDRERLYRIFALVEPCQSTIFLAGAVAADPKLPVDAISNANSGESRPDANAPAFRVE